MKFLSYFSVAALVLLGVFASGCTQSDLVADQLDKSEIDEVGYPVTGTIYVSGNTRVTKNEVSVLSSFVGKGFDAFVYTKAADNSITNPLSCHVDVVQSGTNYTFKILKSNDEALIWEKGQTLYINALFNPNHSDTNTGGMKLMNDGNLCFNYQEGFFGKEDILVAKDSKTFATTDTTVPQFTLNFSHIFSQVSATIQAPDDNYTYVLYYMEFSCLNVPKRGTTDSADILAYTLSGDTPAWQRGDKTQQFALWGREEANTTQGVTGYWYNNDYLEVPFVKDGVSAYAIGSETDTPNAFSSDRLFLIPTPVVSATDDYNATLRVVYSVFEKGTYKTSNEILRLPSTEVTKNIKLEQGANKLYKITLPILPAIGGTVDISAWANGSGVEVTDF